jgi:hypothetical protein
MACGCENIQKEGEMEFCFSNTTWHGNGGNSLSLVTCSLLLGRVECPNEFEFTGKNRFPSTESCDKYWHFVFRFMQRRICSGINNMQIFKYAPTLKHKLLCSHYETDDAMLTVMPFSQGLLITPSEAASLLRYDMTRDSIEVWPRSRPRLSFWADSTLPCWWSSPTIKFF